MDFSHWNMALDFSVREVACLACGIEPEEDINNPKVTSVEKLLMDAYRRCRGTCLNILHQNERDRWDNKEETYFRNDPDCFELRRELPSIQLRQSFSEALKELDPRGLIPFNKDTMRFSRYDLENFFNESNFKPDILFFDIIKKREDDGVQNSIEQKHKTDRIVTTKEGNTLLTMIAVLCKEAKLDYTKASKTAGLIRDMADRMGLSLGETTIEGYLKKIPDALETRMK